MKIFDLLEQNYDEVESTELPTGTIIGLSSGEAKKRLAKDGENKLATRKKVKPLKIFFSQYKDIMTVILIACTAISWVWGEYVEAISIAAIILMNGFLGFLQEYKTERTLEALKNMAAPQARVYRDGKLCLVKASELCVGDVVTLKAGDKIPADGILLEAVALECDEAMLTGESLPVKKAVGDDGEGATIYMGCVVTKGHCTFKVSHIGMNTKMGSIALMLQEIAEEPTPLQKRLATLSKYIAVGCLLICAVVTVTGVLRGEALMQMLITGVSLAVAAVPEGLPAIVTISLALSVSRMVKRNALVRRLHAVETLGCATVICSDKTGTLTQNKMTATKVFTGMELKNADTLKLADSGEQMLLTSMVVCNNADLSSGYGDHTELCLLELAKRHNSLGVASNYKREDELPFDSTRKRMSVIASGVDGRRYMFTKGAADFLLPRCTMVRIGDNDIVMSSLNRAKIEQAISDMADSALRVICIAYKKADSSSSEEQLVFLGLVGMIDPPRKEVKGAIASCYRAGIKTVMITGDHKKTAIAIAKEVGLYKNGDLVLTGYEIDNMSFDELSAIINRVSVFARVNPSHKLMIVRAFKRHGHIVAMTGDGVNDAPAIKEADIGVSMGITGTDVTREASEIVLLDDNFATLVNAVDEGRGIYRNIRKFIRYLLACNIGEVLTMFLGMLMGMPVILLPIQILLVNLVTDGLPAIALGLEPTDKNAMNCPPRKGNESVFSNGLAYKIIIRGILIGLTTLASFVTLFSMSRSVEIARTGAFFALIFAQLIHVFECKSEEKGLFSINLFDNKKLIAATTLSLITLLAVVYIAPLQVIFKTVSLSLSCVAVPIIYSLFAPILVSLFRKK